MCVLGRWVGERRKETERQRQTERQTKGLIGLHLQRVLDGRTVLSVLLHISLVLGNINIL